MAKFMRYFLCLVLGYFTLIANGWAQESPSCKLVRFANVGWTDISATTGISTTILKALGYDTQVRILSVPVTYASLSTGDIDIFLGYWDPSMTPDLRPYLANGSVEMVRYNLVGAKYTLAVPQFLYDQGLKSFQDITRFGNVLDYSIFGIEPGNDGNNMIASMIKDNAYNLGKFRLIETSEQAMLAEVSARIDENKPIVFLGWDPHPMNVRFKMAYLSGDERYFGPNYGGAQVGTNVRKGYIQECSNVGRFLQNLSFTLDMESEIMVAILEGKQDPESAARRWLQAHPDAVTPWLDGVTSVDGGNAQEAVLTALASEVITNQQFYKLPVGQWTANMIDFLKARLGFAFEAVRLGLGAALSATLAVFLWPNPFILIALLALLAWFMQRDWRIVMLTVLGFLYVINQGYWIDTMETLTLLFWSCILCMGLGIPIGIYCAHRPKTYQMVQPILDLMQTLPTFVYLIPAIILFRIGMVPGLIATIVFVLPAPIRLVEQGISSTPATLLEAGKAFGASARQRLWKVELPFAMPQIRASMTQTIMLSLSMVVIAATVGGNGLGVKVYNALQQYNAALGFEAGSVIVVVAIVLDRLFRPKRSK